jgi:uncharacterized protein (DUF1778 family)
MVLTAVLTAVLAVRTSSGQCYREAMTKTAQEPNRRHRLEVRVTPEQEALIRQAADLEHETVTSFVLATATERARRVLKTHSTVTLSNEAFDRFYAALDKPAKEIPELVELFRSKPVLRV